MRRRQTRGIREALRKHWRVRTPRYRLDEPGLVVRQLEERRVLSISPAVALALAAVNTGADVAQPVVNNPDPATPLGTDSAHFVPVDSGDRTVQGDEAKPSDQKDYTDKPAIQDLTKTDNASTASPNSIEADVVENLDTEGRGLEIMVVGDQPPIAEGTELSIPTIAEFTDTRLSEDPVYQFTINWGDGLTSTGIATIDSGSQEPIHGAFGGMHTYADNGVYTVTVTVVSPFGDTASGTFKANVFNVAPSLIVPGTQVTFEGATLNLPGIGQVSDPGFDNPLNVGGEVTERFTFAINWGDGTDLDTGPVTILASNMTPTTGFFDGSHVYANDGTYIVTVTVNDDDFGRVMASFTVEVRNVAPQVVVDPPGMINENESVTLTGTFVDPGRLDEHFVTIDWDDPNNADNSTFALTPTNTLFVGQTFASTTDSAVFEITSLDLESGTVTFRVQHLYLDDGSAPGNNTATDVSTIVVVVGDELESSEAQAMLLVKNVAPEFVPASVIISTPGGGSANEGDTVTLSAAFTDVGTLDAHTVVIDWGDGTTSNSALTPGDFSSFVDSTGGVVGSFAANHKYVADGEFTITIQLIDDDGGAATAAVQLMVNNVAPQVILDPPGMINENDSVTLTGTLVDPGLADEHFVTVDWDDPNDADGSTFFIDPTNTLFVGQTFDSTTDVAVFTITSLDLENGTVGFSVQRQYLDDGSAPGNDTAADVSTIVVVVGDEFESSEAQAALLVKNVAPEFVPGSVIISTPGGEGANEGDTVTLSAAFTDVGTLDAHTVVIDWGDGTTSNSALTPGDFSSFVDSTGGVGGSFAANHKYVADGEFTITIQLIDDDGGQTTQVVTLIVHNVAPQVVVAQPGIINENQSVMLTGTYTDPGLHDEHVVTIEWDDPNDADNSTFVIDPTDTLFEGQTFVSSTEDAFLFITFVDLETGTVGFSVNHRYRDDGGAPGNATTSDVSNVTVTVTDDRQDAGSAVVEVTVRNVAPTIFDLDLNSTGTGPGGPLVLMGIDAEDGGIGGHGPISVYESVILDILASVNNGGSGILVIGGGKDPTDNVTQFWNQIAQDLSVDVTYVNGATDIANMSLDGYAMIVVVSDEFNTPDGGLTNAENDALSARAADVRDFVNDGGGLLGFSSADLANPYGYLGGIGSFTISNATDYNDITPTDAGLDIGITDDLDVSFWHDIYLQFPAFMQVLATVAGTNEAAAIGGRQVVVRLAVIDEGESVTLTASYDDPGTLDAHTVIIHWGDPNSENDSTFTIGPRNTLFVGQTFASTTDSAVLEITSLFSGEGSAVVFRVHHQYLDDGVAPGNATTSDFSNVTVTITDDDSGAGAAAAGVIVQNVAPTITELNVGSTGTGQGGPLVLMGIDAEDGGVGGHGPIAVYESVVLDILANVNNGGSGILVIGGGKDPTDDVTQFWNQIAQHLSLSVTFVNGANDIASMSLDGFAMIVVVSDEFNTPGGGLTNAENDALSTRANEVRDFVNGGGGLLGFSSADLDNPYGYLGGIGSFVISSTTDYNDITPTDAGLDIGITDDLDVSFWHDTYLEFPAFMQVLATVAGTDEAAAIGGRQVVVTSAIIDEGDTVTVTGSFADQGSLDVHMVTIDWGDGSSETYTVAVGNRTFTFTHRYLDDGPSPGNSTPSDPYDVVVSIRDDDTGEGDAPGRVTVRNVIPKVQLNSSEMIVEDQVAVLTGQFSDPGLLDVHDLVVHWDDPNDAADSTFALPHASSLHVGDTFLSTTDNSVLTVTLVDLDSGKISFQLAHRYRDDGLSPGNNTGSDVSIILVSVADDDQARGPGELTNTPTTLMVGNLAPQFVANSLSAIGLTNTLATLGGAISLSAAFTDVGTLDSHTIMVDWGDGTTSDSRLTPEHFTNVADSTGGLVGAMTANHAFAAGGSFTVTIAVIDDDGGVATGQLTFNFPIVVRPPPPSIFVTGGGGTTPPKTPEPAGPPARTIAATAVNRVAYRSPPINQVAGAEPRLVLRVGSSTEVERLPDNVLDHLQELFRRLPDGRYRIYRIQPDGVERLVVDVIVRQGRNIDFSDESEDLGGTPGRTSPQAAPPQETEAPPPGPVSAPSTNDGARRDESDRSERELSAAALVLGGGSVAYAAPFRRRRLAPPKQRPAGPTKARRLLRRLRAL